MIGLIIECWREAIEKKRLRDAIFLSKNSEKEIKRLRLGVV